MTEGAGMGCEFATLTQPVGVGHPGVDVPEVPPWLLDTSVDVNEEGEEDSEGSVDMGVDVPEVVEATVTAGMNLPSGPLL